MLTKYSMSKLPPQHKFLDVSDYGRPFARHIAKSFEHTAITPVHVTCMFIVSGLCAIAAMVYGYYVLALLLLVFKSVLDAADGELARIKNTPSYTGRYFDSVSDILLNAGIFYTVYTITDSSFLWAIIAFACLQLQGTLYNYYYVILRNKVDGDTTSRVFETETPTALPGEKQQTVSLLFAIYRLLYGAFDAIIYFLDRNAYAGKILPNWFMTSVSFFGLGFQLLLIGVLLVTGLKDFIIPIFISLSLFVFLFIGIRKMWYAS
jgi:phosphatidylglycerophosphate synthase